MSRKWKPNNDALTAARIKRGLYRCAGCKEAIPASTVIKGKKVKNAIVDHINPVIDPDIGFTTWEDYINRLFCEVDNLQVLCYACHEVKTNDEKARAKARREREKNEQL